MHDDKTRGAKLKTSVNGLNVIPHISLETPGLLKTDKLDAWADLVRPIYDIKPIKDGIAHNNTSADAWLLGNLLFTDVRFGPQAFDRNKKHIQADEYNYLSLQIYRSGHCSGMLGDTPIEMKEGMVHLLDYSRPLQTVAEPSHVEGVKIAHYAVGYDPKKHPPHMCFDLQSPVGKLLSRAFWAILTSVRNQEPVEADRLAAAFVGLVKGLLYSEENDNENVRYVVETRKQAIRQYIEANLHDLSLSAATLCREFAVSRATLYRDFDQYGGLQRYLNLRRLDRAMRDLTAAPAARGRVGLIGQKWGFKSVSHFSRAFRQHFGISPSNVELEVRKPLDIDKVKIGGDDGAYGLGVQNFLTRL